MSNQNASFTRAAASMVGWLFSTCLAVIAWFTFALLTIVPMIAWLSYSVLYQSNSIIVNSLLVSCIIPLILFLLYMTVYGAVAIFSPERARAFGESTGRTLKKIWVAVPEPIRIFFGRIIRTAKVGGAFLLHWLAFGARAVSRAIEAASRATETAIAGLGKAIMWLLCAGVLCGIAYGLFQGIAALPVSVAVIIGAVIIAGALSK